MRPFRFKLKGLLQLKEFQEYHAKIKLGEINKKITAEKNKLKKTKLDISNTIQYQEDILKKNETTNTLQVISKLLKGLRQRLKESEYNLKILEADFEKQLVMVRTAKGATELIESLEKKYKKSYNIKRSQKIQADILDLHLTHNSAKKDK